MITQEGWHVVERPPVMFRHYVHQAPQCEPQHGGTMDNLLDLVNLPGKQASLLFQVCLVAALLPDISSPITAVSGEQGSAENNAPQNDAIDDRYTSSLASLSLPDNLREFVQLACPPPRRILRQSQSPSRVALGCHVPALHRGWILQRELYSDDEDVIYAIRGLGGINGINLVATKPDLLDRCIIFRLEAIPPEKRLPEQALWHRFQEIKPLVLGSMFDALCAAIRRHSIPRTVGDLPRMADFALWGMDIAEALGHTSDEFMRAYKANVQLQNESALEESPVAQAVLAFVKEGQEWEGTASDLMSEFERRAEELKINPKAREWPKGPNVLSRRLREVMPVLRRVGVTLVEQRTADSKIWHLARKAPESTVQIDHTVTAEADSSPDDNRQASSPADRISSQQDSVSSSGAASNDRRNDGSDDSDGVFPISTARSVKRKIAADAGEV